MPARMKLCTNWRWNSRKATSSGAEVMSVAAVMIDQSTPWSVTRTPAARRSAAAR
jgi:hypothetical protein